MKLIDVDTGEAVEIVYSKKERNGWIKVGKSNKSWACSGCDMVIQASDPYPYCPFCGSLMDKTKTGKANGPQLYFCSTVKITWFGGYE